MSGNKDLKQRKTEVLNNSYRKDGLVKYATGDYKGALKLFNLALRLSPADVKSLVYRSKCHKKLRNVRKAIDDVDTALHIHNLSKEALLQKASLLYQSSNYELALVYYSRGHKHYPQNKDFIIGKEKAEMGINKGRKSRGRRMKLTEAGDLTYLVHKVPHAQPFSWKKPESKSQNSLVPSATFNTRPLCQLIRIHKTPSVSLSQAETPHDENDDDSTVLNYDEKRPESRVVKKTMGKLYSDKKYLQHLIEDDQFPAVMGSSGSPVGDIAEDGFHFLLDRAAYWDRLGPLPPPPPARRFRSRFSGSTLSMNSLDSFKTTDTKASWKSTDSTKTLKTTKSSRYSFSSKKEKSSPKPDPSKVEFKFPSIRLFDDFHQRMMTEIAEEQETDESANRTSDSEADQNQEDTAKKSVMEYMKKEMNAIDEDFRSNKFRNVQDRCEACLELLGRYYETEIPDKFEMVSNLYSYLGNASMQLGKLDLALKYHQLDLSIGEQLDRRNIRYRALGNTGRVFMMKGKHKKALDMFIRKAPLCNTPRETASLFHEIGNCFLMLNNFHSARESGRKSMKAAEEAGNVQQQLQACVLVGLAEVNMKKYERAHSSFERALDYAKSLGDERAELAMKKALVDVNRKIALKIKKNNSSHVKVAQTYPDSDVSTARTSILVE
ncbi:outer dynein arm-docking complex subunit 4-like [Saccostrea cucullata]|uniref:outer dynein arm-docking complex subunit 4-like n=1 Tax=Saccostrea cuccullata TaxID=36930 RepID=UPI002ECFD7FA